MNAIAIIERGGEAFRTNHVLRSKPFDLIIFVSIRTQSEGNQRKIRKKTTLIRYQSFRRCNAKKATMAYIYFGALIGFARLGPLPAWHALHIATLDDVPA